MAKGIGEKAKTVLTVIAVLLVIALLVGVVYRITSASPCLPPGGGEEVPGERRDLDENGIIFGGGE